MRLHAGGLRSVGMQSHMRESARHAVLGYLPFTAPWWIEPNEG
jgi:hypothetical protein